MLPKPARVLVPVLGAALLLIFALGPALLLSGCLRPSPPHPAAPVGVGQEPTESPWRTGTPVPLFAPLTGECLGATGETGQSRPPSSPRRPYGINAFLLGTDAERVLTLTGIAGFGWVRQQIHWRDLEGKRGQLVWTPLDQVVSAARSHDLHIMLSVVRSPAWATATGHSGLPDDPTTLATFLQQVATRYRGRVSAYEIWNEPNLAHESGGVPGDPATYLATLQAAYPAIKAADPCALVLAAPLAATNQADPAVAADDLPFYEALYELDDGAFRYAADAVAIHPGAGPYPPEARWPASDPQQSHHYFRHIERVHDLMHQQGDPRPVWITEVGWNVSPARGPRNP
ncbi:MAG: glycoside hydrolase family 5 protein [Chloroflexaceae bacterium]|nr:glycoside hydrolase family 5 protein [Chloroflexaceae bacterium]